MADGNPVSGDDRRILKRKRCVQNEGRPEEIRDFVSMRL